MYQVSLAADGQSLQWRSIDPAGRSHFSREEPHDSAGQRVLHWLQSLFISESLL